MDRPSLNCPGLSYPLVPETERPTTFQPVQGSQRRSLSRRRRWNGTGRRFLNVWSLRLAIWSSQTNLSGTEVPATPSGNLALRNPRSLAFASTPRPGAGTTTSAPGSGRFHRTASGSHMNIPGGISGFSGTKGGDTSLRRPISGDGLDVSRPPLVRAEGLSSHIFMPAITKLTRLALPGPSRASPQSAARQTSQHFDLPGSIFRNP